MSERADTAKRETQINDLQRSLWKLEPTSILQLQPPHDFPLQEHFARNQEEWLQHVEASMRKP